MAVFRHLVPTVLLALALHLVGAINGLAQDRLSSMQDEELIAEIWRQKGELAEAFSESFLGAVPPAQIAAVVEPLVEQYGDVADVRALGAGEFELLTETHKVPVFMRRGRDGLIEGLFVRPAVALEIDLAATLQAFVEMGAHVSVLVTTNGQTVAELNPERRLAVGSAFKMHVLAELQARMAAGEMAWADVVRLEAHHISLPSGMMQDWPLGSPVTLQTAAQMMMSVSDNTATDLLIDVLGRDALETRSSNVPFITTRELFHIRANPDLSNRYVQADGVARRRELLAGLAGVAHPDVADIEPFSLDHPAEWYLSAQELCAVMAQVADLPLMAVQPGPLTKRDWQRIAFKGGSEGG
ncbi:MAG: serine hydrolase, partial [Pseudomonadota bacterium]